MPDKNGELDIDLSNSTPAQKKKFVSQFNLMDDTFFSVVMQNKAACEYLLSALLGRPVKCIKSNKTQYSIKNIEEHSIVLDAFIEDENNVKYTIEVQIVNRKNLPMRVRFYSSGINWNGLGKGKDYSELSELYMIIISAFDPFNENKVRYEVKKYLDTGSEYNDGEHILYFNTAVDDGSELSKLLQYLANSSAEEKSFGALSNTVRYHKINEEGVEYMCRIVEEYSNKKGERLYSKGIIEGKIEAVNEMLKDSVPLEVALRYGKIDLETYKKYNKTPLQ